MQRSPCSLQTAARHLVVRDGAKPMELNHPSQTHMRTVVLRRAGLRLGGVSLAGGSMLLAALPWWARLASKSSETRAILTNIGRCGGG